MKRIVSAAYFKTYLKKDSASYTTNLHFPIILFFWLLSGILFGPFVNIVITATLIYWNYHERFGEMLVGLFFILILSDSRHEFLAFANFSKQLYILLLVLFLILNIKKFQPLNYLFLFFVPFFLFASLSILRNDDFLNTSLRTFSYLLLLVVVPNYFLYAYKKDKSDFIRFYLYFGFVILLVGLLLKVILPQYVTFLGARFSGVFGNPNGLGIFSLLYIITYYVFKDKHPKLFSRRVDVSILFVAVLSLFLCFSRSALIAFLFFMVFKNFYKQSRVFGFFVFVFLIFGFQLLMNNLDSIIVSLNLGNYLRIETLDTGSGRIYAYQVALKNVGENIILGKGFGYTSQLFEKFSTELSKLNHQGNAHNSYLTIWLDTGLFGLVFFLVGWFGSLIKWSKNNYLLYPLLYTVIFSSFFESWLAASQNPFTIQLVCIISFYYATYEINNVPEKFKSLSGWRLKLRT